MPFSIFTVLDIPIDLLNRHEPRSTKCNLVPEIKTSEVKPVALIFAYCHLVLIFFSNTWGLKVHNFASFVG